MAVAGESQIRRQSGQIIVTPDQVQSSRQAQAQMISIKRDALDLLKHLRQVYRRAANFTGDFRERPTPGEIAGQQHLDTIGQPPATVSRAALVRCSGSQASADQGKRQIFRFQRLNRPIVEAMPQKSDQCLCARIDALMLMKKSRIGAVTEDAAGRQFAQNGIREAEGETRVAARHGVAHLIAFTGIEKQNMICVGDGLVSSNVTHVYSPIGEYEMRSGCGFLRGAVPARARAVHVTQ
jgi:hypothetical protein